MPPARAQHDAAIGFDPAAADQRQLLRRQARIAQHQRLTRTIAELAGKARRRADQRHHGFVDHAAHQHAHVAEHIPGRAAAKGDAHIRIDIGIADILDPERGQPRIDDRKIAPALAAARKLHQRDEAVAGQPDRIAAQLPIAHAHHALARQPIGQPVAIGVAGDDTRRADLDGKGEIPALPRERALREQPFRAHAGERDAIGGQAIRCLEIAERTVQRHRRAQISGVETLCQQLRTRQRGKYLHIVEAVVAKVDRTFGIDRARLPRQRDHAREYPGIERAPRDHANRRAECAREAAAEQRLRPDKAPDPRLSLALVDIERGKLAIAQPGKQPALPEIPVAPPLDRGGQVPRQPGQCGDRAIGGRSDIAVDLQPVLVGHRINLQRHPVGTIGERGARIDQHAARTDIDLAREIGDAAWPGDPVTDDQPVGAEPIDADIERGQQRVVGIAWPKLRQAAQFAPPDDQIADIEPVVEKPERAPVEVHRRCGEEHPLGIAQLDPAQHRLAIDRPFDPIDAQRQAGLELVAGDLLGEEAAARPAVEPEQQCGHEPAQHQHADDQTAHPAHPRPALHDRFGRGRLCLVRHQKA